MANFTLDDLLNLEPSTVSRDLTGYITYVYGKPKVGKTTLAKDMGALILACEDGTRAMTGAYAQIMHNWADIKAIQRMTKDPRFKERYKAIAIDTVDIAASYCEKYVCSAHGVQAINEIPWGQGYQKLKKEFEDTFREIANQGIAVLFISHDKEKTFKRQDNTEYTMIVPTISDSMNNIVKNMSDIIAYGYQKFGTEDRFMVLRSDGAIEAGTRFPYMVREIPFGYEHLVKALNDAIDEEEKHGGKVVETKSHEAVGVTLDYDEIMGRFNVCAGKLTEKDAEKYGPMIVEIVERHLGTGKKMSECTRNQVEAMALIVDEVETLTKTI